MFIPEVNQLFSDESCSGEEKMDGKKRRGSLEQMRQIMELGKVMEKE